MATRIPFIWTGYGTDSDAWRVARTARSIALTGEYTYSRSPGYPLQEVVSSFFWHGGAPALNFLSAFISALAAVFFYLILKHFSCKDSSLASFAFAFTPAIYLHSTDSMDYLWALCFTLGSMYFVLKEKPLTAGLLLGLATGCRLTSLAFALPFWLLLAKKHPLKSVLTFIIPLAIIAGLCFSPVVDRYGLSFLTHYQGPLPGRDIVINLATIGVWGTLGTGGLIAVILLGIITAFLMIFLKLFYLASIPRIPGIPLLMAILIIFAIFLYLPMSSGYLVPLVPFVLIVLGRYLTRTTFQILCVLLIAAPFVSMENMSFAKGPLLRDQIARKERARITGNVLSFIKTAKDPSVIVIGPWGSQITYYHDKLSNPKVKLAYLLTEEEAKNYLLEGFQIYCLPFIREYNRDFTNVDLSDYGAKPLH